MFLDISVNDLINTKTQKISFNEVIINRQDIIKIPKLMQYLITHHIYFDKSLRLDSLIITQQNEIGLIFFDYYNYTITNDNIIYLNKQKLKELFNESESLMFIINKADSNFPTTVENTLSVKAFSTKDLNLIILNWFYDNYRNFRSIKKNIKETTNLYDINLNAGHFSKITNNAEFLSLMFTRFVRTRKDMIPFSNGFGSSIKESLQTKSNYFAKKNILEEITGFTKYLTNFYDENFELEDIKYKETTNGISVSIKIYVTISINTEQTVKFVLE